MDATRSLNWMEDTGMVRLGVWVRKGVEKELTAEAG
jgi:hypothetical protein